MNYCEWVHSMSNLLRVLREDRGLRIDGLDTNGTILDEMSPQMIFVATVGMLMSLTFGLNSARHYVQRFRNRDSGEEKKKS